MNNQPIKVRRLLIAIGMIILSACSSTVAQDMQLPESPPYQYFYQVRGPKSETQLDTKTVSQIRNLLTQHFRKLEKPFSPHSPGGLTVPPEIVIQVRDANGQNHSQILVLPGVIVYQGAYVVTQKEVIKNFKELLPH